MGLCGLVILFACVRCPPAKEKKPLFAPRLLCLLALCVSLSVCVYTYKKSGLFGSLFLFGWWLLVSPIEQIRTLQAGCRFGLLPLSCLCLFAVLLPWGLQYSTNLLCRLHRCGLCNGIPLLCFSCCFLLSF